MNPQAQECSRLVTHLVRHGTVPCIAIVEVENDWAAYRKPVTTRMPEPALDVVLDPVHQSGCRTPARNH